MRPHPTGSSDWTPFVPQSGDSRHGVAQEEQEDLPVCGPPRQARSVVDEVHPHLVMAFSHPSVGHFSDLDHRYDPPRDETVQRMWQDYAGPEHSERETRLIEQAYDQGYEDALAMARRALSGR